MPGSINYYSSIPPPMNNPYVPPTVGTYYPPNFPMQQPNMIPRPSFGMYHPTLHHPPPPGGIYMTPQPAQNPYQISNAHLYQMPPSVSIPYGPHAMMQPPITDLYGRPDRP